MDGKKWDTDEYVECDNYYRKKLELAIEEFKQMHPDVKVGMWDVQNTTRLYDFGMNFCVRLSLNLRDTYDEEIPEGYDCAVAD